MSASRWKKNCWIFIQTLHHVGIFLDYWRWISCDVITFPVFREWLNYSPCWRFFRITSRMNSFSSGMAGRKTCHTSIRRIFLRWHIFQIWSSNYILGLQLHILPVTATGKLYCAEQDVPFGRHCAQIIYRRGHLRAGAAESRKYSPASPPVSGYSRSPERSKLGEKRTA